jgi:hypothetical protein
MRPRPATLLALLVATAAVAAVTLGPGDPTTVFVDGFTTPCRATVGPDGSLYVVDLGDRAIHRVTPDGVKSLFSDDIGDPRGMTFDAFGYLLVPDRDNNQVHRVASDGAVSPFLQMFRPIRSRVGPDGDIWIAAVDSLHRYDAMGRHVWSVDVAAQGAAAFGLQFNPNGDLYFTAWAGFWRLDGQTVVPVMTGMQVRMGAPHFDVSGNAYWIHEAVEEGDTHRMILGGPDLAVTDGTFASFEEGPCSHVFGRDASGVTTNRQFVGLRNGTIVELNASGIPAPGVSETGLRLTDIGQEDVVDEILLQSSAVTDDQLYFLDVIGNNEGTFDIGDFRAFLIANGTVE